MSLTPSTMLDLGTKAPDFSLPDVVTGNRVTLETFADAEALVVIFMCNHCPYVKHLRSGIVALVNDYREQGVKVVAISSNDADKYPDDGPEKMADEAKRYEYTFPYLYDESQEVAKAYQAACTPDFYVFDSNRELIYRGQFDDSRPGNDKPVTGSDVREALDLLSKEGKVLDIQKPSVGCNIKWKPGNEPDYFG